MAHSILLIQLLCHRHFNTYRVLYSLSYRLFPFFYFFSFFFFLPNRTYRKKRRIHLLQHVCVCVYMCVHVYETICVCVYAFVKQFSVSSTGWCTYALDVSLCNQVNSLTTAACSSQCLLCTRNSLFSKMIHAIRNSIVRIGVSCCQWKFFIQSFPFC